MTERFRAVFERVIGHEGRYSNNPRDNGGETMFGITVAVARAHGYAGPMRDMPLDVAREIYRTSYWEALRCDLLPAPIDEFAFDFGVNSGTGRAARALQRAVGVLPDGAIGPKTLAAVATRLTHDTLRLMFVERALLFARHEDLDEFGNGWFARLFDKTVQAAIENRQLYNGSAMRDER